MNNKLFILISFYILFFTINSSGKTYILFGINNSSFATDGVSSKAGNTVVLGKDWHIYKPFGLCFETMLSNRNCTLNDKSIRPGDDYLFTNKDEIFYVNIHVALTNLDLPLLLRINLINNTLKLNMISGYGITVNLSNKTNGTVSRIIPAPFSEIEKFDFDYRGRKYNEDYDYGGFISSHLGLRLLYKFSLVSG